MDSSTPFDLNTLYKTIVDRLHHPMEGSFTSELLTKGEDEILKKIGEEAVEIILAGKAQGNERLLEEVADLTYFVIVLLANRNLTPADVLQVLEARSRRGK